PFVVTGPLVGVPRCRIRRAVVDEVERRIIRDPTPCGPTASSPRRAGPSPHAEIGPALSRVKGSEARTDEYIPIGTGVVRAPSDLAAAQIERSEPATYP